MEHALGRWLSPVLVSGGGSRSDLTMQVVADVYGRPARRTTVNDAAGLGAAICAAVGHGIYPGWDQATAAMVSPGQQFTPDSGAARAHQQINQVYATLTSHTDPLFRSRPTAWPAWTARDRARGACASAGWLRQETGQLRGPHGAVCLRSSRRLRAHSSASVSRLR
jgi:hypothetical protein